VLGVKDALIVSALSLLPRRHGARTMGWMARQRASRAIVRLFVKAYGVNLDEADGTLADYPTLEALFTRTLKDGVRPIHDAPDAMVSPVDGTVAAVGRTTNGKIELAPDRFLNLADLLGEPVDGELEVAVIYLSPKDYHRVHVPREGIATRWRYVPGTLWPVFPAAVQRVKGLFSRNERVVVHTVTSAGPVDVVLVGAFGVGRITVSVCDIITNTGGAAAYAKLETPVSLRRGAELGVFHLGSTVVVSAPAGRWRWSVTKGQSLLQGEAIAEIKQRFLHDGTAPS
jgi:phosphatidylserine decarboxylase